MKYSFTEAKDVYGNIEIIYTHDGRDITGRLEPVAADKKGRMVHRLLWPIMRPERLVLIKALKKAGWRTSRPKRRARGNAFTNGWVEPRGEKR